MTKSSEAGRESTGARVKEQGSQAATGAAHAATGAAHAATGAAHAATGAAQTGKHLMQAAAGQGGQVAREAGRTARGLVDQAQTELKDQAGMQQKRAAEGLRMLGDQLRAMAEKSGQPGMAKDLVDDASGRVHRAADWLEHRDPGQVMEELRNFARHHPGRFLLGAAVAGALVGRLTRDLAQADGHGGAAPAPAPAPESSAFPEVRP
jgi:hypothetical protein